MNRPWSRREAMQRLLSNGAWLAVGRVGNILALLCLNVVVTRIWSIEEVGWLLSITTATFVFSSLSTIGLDHAATKISATLIRHGEWTRIGGLVGNGLFISFVIGGMLGLLAIVIVGPNNNAVLDEAHLYLIIPLVLNGIMGAMRSVVAGVLRGVGRFNWVMLVDGFGMNGGMLMFAGVLYFTSFGATISNLLWWNVGWGLIILLLSSNAACSRYGRLQVNFREMKELLLISPSLMIPPLCWALFAQIPLSVMHVVGTAADVAIVGVGLQIGALSAIAAVIAFYAGAPALASLDVRRDRQQFVQAVEIIGIAQSLPALIVAVGLLLFGGPFCVFAFGPAYEMSGYIGAAIAIGRCVQCVAGPGHTVLMMAGYGHIQSGIEVLQVAVIAIFTTIGYLAGGILGVAIGIGAAIALYGGVLSVVVKILLGFSPAVSIPRLCSWAATSAGMIKR